jgi:hypothetical protein
VLGAPAIAPEGGLEDMVAPLPFQFRLSIDHPREICIFFIPASGSCSPPRELLDYPMNSMATGGFVALSSSEGREMLSCCRGAIPGWTCCHARVGLRQHV